jgi:enoyl-CoA hydratase/carnithine racemase
VPEIGAFKAKQLFLTGQKVSPKEALNLGLITAIANDETDDSELDKLVDKYVQQILEGGKSTVDFQFH